MRLQRVFLAFGAATSLSCSSGVQPTPIDDPAISCPSDIRVTAHNGVAPTISFETPVPLKGVPPVTVACTPPSQTQFANDATIVTCRATDSRQHQASCTFSVVVTPVPQLLKTRFMVFGDSLTEGKVTLSARSAVVVPPNIFNDSRSCVEQLNAKLVARYQDQSIEVIAEGKGGEDAGEGKLRLTGELLTYKPDALLLLDGANDLISPTTSTSAGMQAAINSAAEALQNMVRQGKARGARVFLGTLPPMIAPRPDNVVAAVPTLNARIRSLASAEAVTLVDLYGAIPTTAVGADGLHLKPQGYELMADEWFKAIVATMEIKSSSLQ